MVPKLWSETIEAHRHSVRDAILDAVAALVAEHGVLAMTMAHVAETAGIGRATIYKYFPDTDALLVAWHDRRIAEHFARLHEVQAGNADVGAQLEEVLEAYALMIYERPHDAELAALVHRGEHFDNAQRRLNGLVCKIVSKAAKTGNVRNDVAPRELAGYCLHALAAANTLTSEAAVRRLVAVTLTGLRPASTR